MTMATTSKDHKNHVYTTNLSNIRASNERLPIQIRKHNVALFYHNFKVYAESIERIKKDLEEYFKNKEKQGRKRNIASQTIIKGNKRRNRVYNRVLLQILYR